VQGALGHDWGSTVSTSIPSYWACVPTNVTYKAPKRSATTTTTTSRSSLPLMLNTTRRWSTKLALQNWALMSAGVPHRALRATASQAINGALAPGPGPELGEGGHGDDLHGGSFGPILGSASVVTGLPGLKVGASGRTGGETALPDDAPAFFKPF